MDDLYSLPGVVFVGEDVTSELLEVLDLAKGVVAEVRSSRQLRHRIMSVENKLDDDAVEG